MTETHGNRGSETEKFVNQAFDAGFDGTQARALGKETAQYIGRAWGVPLNSGTAAMHLALKLAAERLYGSAGGISTPDGLGRGGSLCGKRVFCPDFAAVESAAPVVYEGGEPIFIDCGETDWSMDPEVLELAFGMYPDVRIVILNHAYGFPGQVMEILRVCREHGALLIEDCSESLGGQIRTGQNSQQGAGDTPDRADTDRRPETGDSRRKEDLGNGQEGPDAAEGGWRRAGSFGDYAVLDFGPGRIISGGDGGMLLTDDRYSAEKALYWAGGARAMAPWDQHEELGYSYRMSDLTAAAVRGQLKHLDGAIEKKKAIYERYVDRLDSDLTSMIPVGEGTRPNYWMSCMTCESSIGFKETRDDRHYTYTDQHGTAAPMEIYDALTALYGEADGGPGRDFERNSTSRSSGSSREGGPPGKCRPLYKPLSLQPVFWNHEAVTLDGGRRSYRHFYEDNYRVRCHRAKEYFERGIGLPSDVNMMEEDQEKVMEIILACYSGSGFNRMMMLERKERGIV